MADTLVHDVPEAAPVAEERRRPPRVRRTPTTYVLRTIAAAYLFFLVAWPVSLVVTHTFDDGLESIREFFARFGQDEAFGRSNEVKILKKFARDIRKKLPVDPIEKLRAQLQKAVAREQYEDAARIRDEIRRKTEEVE